MQFTDEQLARHGYQPHQFDRVRQLIAERRLERMRRSDDSPADHPTEDEYASERLGARELGVGRFYDGRGL